MFVEYLLQGIIVGFLVAMPVGPIALVCMRDSLNYGFIRGFIAGVGSAAADAIFGLVAAFSLTAVGALLLDYRTEFQLFGAIILCFFGFLTFFAKFQKNDSEKCPKGFMRTFFTTFLLTLTNPMTILAFMAVYAAIGLGESPLEIMHGAFLTVGVFMGSSLWWFCFSGLSSHYRKKLNEHLFGFFNRITGFIIFCFGAFAFLTA